MQELRLAVILLLAAATTAEETPPAGPTPVDTARAAMRGALFVPGDPGFDEASSTMLWNADPTLQKTPAVIAQVRGQSDVAKALELANAMNLSLTIRSGGHSMRGASTIEGGLVIDMREMRSVRVHKEGMYVWAEGGCMLSDVDKECAAQGVATPTGTVGCTGIGGLTTGGGFGWLGAQHGFAVDQVLEVEMVLADGRPVRASPTENEDLFWAIRGGGGAFGVVTAFKLRTVEIPSQIYSGMYLMGEEHEEAALASLEKWVRSGPSPKSNALTLYFNPEFGPARFAGFVMHHLEEDMAAGEQAFKTLMDTAAPVVDMMGPKSYTQMQSLFDGGFCARTGFYFSTVGFTIDGFFTDSVKELLKEARASRNSQSMIIIENWAKIGAAGLATSDKEGIPQATAMMTGRNVEITLLFVCQFNNLEERETNVAWVRKWRAAAKKLSDDPSLAYINYNSADEAEQAEEINLSKKTEIFDKLRQVKHMYDPDNIFSHSHLSVAPLSPEECMRAQT